jgi:flagellar biosynthesis protein FliR
MVHFIRSPLAFVRVGAGFMYCPLVGTEAISAKMIG